MKNHGKKLILLLLFIPYVYFSLLLDYRYHSVFGLIFLIFLIFLSFYAGFSFQKKQQLLFLFFINISSTFISYLICHYYSDWHFFYQPFKPTQLILLLSVLYLIPQILGAFWARIFTR
ncbi:hypothetical protein ACG6P0_000938 [Enterococcus hirae]|uniref:hypothetical protein n=1 Tax=Enterococcus TaxID=1350 RepID=UPI0005552195|nr:MULTISPECIES: hypothetical protein [Enterococcus]OWW70255.1 hypothetical protein C655_03845 [Enterococcus hirae 57-09-G6]EMF0044686.1 hypothetical protein [Enterococcus hirae]EMF0053054.1 hypothetical protein [Enterococcus hirae]EMF0056978.1 hypothetical protein [Enterococcus hirae]EMF0071438.1 hypothetical protein [Enterococcus hirae]